MFFSGRSQGGLPKEGSDCGPLPPADLVPCQLSAPPLGVGDNDDDNDNDTC